MDTLRFATAGSVDDGKSTLIGRLLYDTKSVHEDQLQSVERISRDRGDEYTNLALLTDGLRAEREQGITIDVAHRYFTTAKRRFVIADTPGHIQYTRNMVTGASTADAALILVDARGGITEQSRRHAFVASLLRVPHLVLCVNKMDLVDFALQRFEDVKQEFLDFATRLEVPDLTVIPISALHGDNVVTRSDRLAWYEGPPLLHHLEELYVASDRNLIDTRFPVQYVIRPMSAAYPDYRGYAGRVTAGVLRVGDEVTVLPSGLTSRIVGIDRLGQPVEEAFAPMSVTVRLADHIDISRGDMICRPHNQPRMVQDVEAMICWFAEQAMTVRGTYTIKHTAREARALIKDLQYRVDVNTLRRDQAADVLRLNEIGRVTLRSTLPLLADDYRRNRATGSFILIDEFSHATVGAGMIL